MTRDEAVNILQTVASRGFMSDPVTSWMDKKTTAQYIAFTDEEKAAMRRYLGDNPHLSKMGRHPIPSFFGDAPSRTVSLLSRISYAVGGEHITPDYVSGLAAELDESATEYQSLWHAVALERMVS